MSITSIKRDSNSNVSIVRMISTDTLATIASANYIKNQMPVIKELNDGNWQWFLSDVILCAASDANGFFQFTDTTFSTLVLIASDTDGTVTPGLANQIAIYPANGTVLSGSNTLPSLVQVHPLNFNNGTGATANKFYAGDGTWKLVSSTTNHSIYSVYVSPDGSDITGNGTILSPYKTITHALNVITTASSSTPYKIICSSGVFSESSLVLKPWINIDGQGSRLIVLGSITQDASWSSGGEIQFGNFCDVNIGGNINLDFSIAGSNPCSVYIHNIEFTAIATLGEFTVKGGDGNLSLIISQIFSFNSAINVSVENAYGALYGGSCYNFDYTASSLTTSFVFNLLNFVVIGATTYTTTVGAMGVGSIIGESKIISGLNLNGTGTNISVDSCSLFTASLPVITGGATVVYVNPSNSLFANYTPVNYTPDSTGGTSPSSSVAAHLHGIDNALIGSVHSSEFSVYVSPDGNDTTGTGSPTNPYQTIVHALSTITTNSASNIFNIVLGGGVYNETSQINLKPWVNIVGFSRETKINNSLDIILDSSWNGTSTGTIEISQVSISNNLNIDFTSTATADGPVVFIDNIILSGNFIIQGNTVNPCNFYIRNSMFNNTFIDNAVVFSFSNIYFLAFSSGTNPFIAPLNYSSLGDYYGNGLLLTGASSGPINQFVNIRSCYINPTLSVSGTNITLNIDVSSYINPTISGSPTINLDSISNGLSSNYSPTTYIPDTSGTTGPFNNSVAAHLHGIDNALNAGVINWTNVTGISQNASVSNGYVANNSVPVTINLPALASFGQIISIQGNGSGGFVVVANTGQIIHVDIDATSAGGTISSTGRYQSLDLICTEANTTWVARNFIGTFLYT